MTHPHDTNPRDQPSSADDSWLRDLEANSRDPRQRAELRAVALLLRGLPDPEPPDGLVVRVLEKVAEREARPTLIRRAFRQLAEPRLAAALAAGVSCLLVVTAVQNGVLEPAPQLAGAVASSETRPVNPTFDQSPVLRVERPAAFRAGAPANPQFVSMWSTYPRSDALPAAPGFQTGLRPANELLERRLDSQLNQLLLDPAAFCERLERVSHRDRFIARMAGRAAERGDAIEVALRVRSSNHPLTQQLVDQFLRASLVERISQR